MENTVKAKKPIQQNLQGWEKSWLERILAKPLDVNKLTEAMILQTKPLGCSCFEVS